MAKKNITVHLLSLSVLCIGFVLCRTVFFDLHGMFDLPRLLFLSGLFVIGLSLFAKARLVPVVTALGYIVGFWAGVVFQTDGVDPGGGRTNNLWIFWVAVFACAILFSSLIEAFLAVRQKAGKARV